MLILVNMPGADVTRPSLALGILQATLQREGVRVQTIGANLDWLDRIGADVHQRVLGTAPSDMVVEWIFTAAAFPEHTVDAEAFFELVSQRDAALAREDRASFVDGLTALRLDAVAFVETLADRIVALAPVAVGATSMFQQHLASLALLRAVKARRPGVVTLLGGANCEGPMGVVTHRRCDWVDYVVSGEADTLITPLWRTIETHGTDAPEAALPFGVLGPVHRRAGSYPTDDAGRPARAVVDSIDDVPTPNFDDYFDELRTHPAGRLVVPGLPFETSRGCWWGAKHHCTFCGLNGSGMGYRARSPERAAEEIRTLEARHDVPRLEAVDNILAMPYFDSLLPALERDGSKRALFFETKANLKTSQVDQLARAGVRWIQPGIESLDTRVLALMRKGTTALQNVRLLRDCAQRGVRVAWATIVGFPGEDDAWHAETAALLDALSHLPPGGVAALRFDRFSPYHQTPEQWGLNLSPAAPYRHVYPFDDADLHGLAYYWDAAHQGELVGDLRYRTLSAPGLAALREAALRWDARHTAGARLDAAVLLDAWEVTDSRDGGRVEQAAVGAEAAALAAFESGVTRAAGEAAVRSAGHTATAAGDAVDALLTRRWLVELDGRILSLVLRRPVEEPLPEIAFPGGTLLRPELFDP
ncbi:MAG: RiPP maturation radical SAM protein 1 [Myxococcales bacterium]|nr:RiPP maturation radical SAM protein 1 [Myxococcales bacterium]